jgi:hypothetical protein
MGSLFGHSTKRITGEDAIHVEVEVGDASLYGVNAKRIEGGIELEDTVEQLRMLTYNACQFIAHHLPLELVTMGACDDTKACGRLAVMQDFLANIELLIDRELG